MSCTPSVRVGGSGGVSRSMNNIQCVSETSSNLERAKGLAVEAVRWDTEGSYDRAASTYREAISLFKSLGRKELGEKHPRVRSGLKEKIQLCSERLRILEEFNECEGSLRGYQEEEEEQQSVVMKEVMSGSTHSLYPHCEIKRAISIMSSDFGLGEELPDVEAKPPLANLDKELRLSLSSLSSDEGITTMQRRPRKEVVPCDEDAILVLHEDHGDSSRLLESSFEDDKQPYRVRAESDSGISEERTSSSSDIHSERAKDERLSSFSGSAYELYVSEEVLSGAETSQPTRERYAYAPRRAKKQKEKDMDGCFYLMACLDAFGVL
eukprot:TRINITY_DN1878_c0_g1_i2.p1 TRINITY_DN1878_c0_g1~~TRINITY_DN1878_c0_g1_i2.p1  ORF type:complete len:323 (-),score=94.79 TRINITY_DN1878_c0_g1_i2:651-1619(-)